MDRCWVNKLIYHNSINFRPYYQVQNQNALWLRGVILSHLSIFIFYFSSPRAPPCYCMCLSPDTLITVARWRNTNKNCLLLVVSEERYKLIKWWSLISWQDAITSCWLDAIVSIGRQDPILPPSLNQHSSLSTTTILIYMVPLRMQVTCTWPCWLSTYQRPQS